MAVAALSDRARAAAASAALPTVESLRSQSEAGDASSTSKAGQSQPGDADAADDDQSKAGKKGAGGWHGVGADGVYFDALRRLVLDESAGEWAVAQILPALLAGAIEEDDVPSVWLHKLNVDDFCERPSTH